MNTFALRTIMKSQSSKRAYYHGAMGVVAGNNNNHNTRRVAPPTRPNLLGMMPSMEMMAIHHHLNGGYNNYSMDEQRSAFHTTRQLDLPVRRRKRGQKHVDDDDDEEDGPNFNPLKHTPVRDPTQFSEASVRFLNKIETAVEPMKAMNETFVVERSRGDMGDVLTIDLGPKEGTYRIEMSVEESMFEYTSPISGKVLYVLSATTGEWVGHEDGHSFEGLLVRDLIRQCQGLPDL